MMPTVMLLLRNSFPSAGLIVSALTMCISNGRLPVMRIVCSLFISLMASAAASCSVVP